MKKISVVHKIILNKMLERCNSDNCITNKMAREVIGKHFRMCKENTSKVLHELYKLDLINVNHGQDIEILCLKFEFCI